MPHAKDRVLPWGLGTTLSGGFFLVILLGVLGLSLTGRAMQAVRQNEAACAPLGAQGTPARDCLEIQLGALGAVLNSYRVGVVRTEEQSRARTLAVVSALLPPRHPESGPLLRLRPGRRQKGRRRGCRAGGH